MPSGTWSTTSLRSTRFELRRRQRGRPAASTCRRLPPSASWPSRACLLRPTISPRLRRARFRNVYAMAPPINNRSTTFIRFWITSILSETFAPPRIETHGPIGILGGLGQVLDLFVHQQPGGGLLRRRRSCRRSTRARDARSRRRHSHRCRTVSRAVWRTRDRSSLPRRGSAGSPAAARRRERATSPRPLDPRNPEP